MEDTLRQEHLQPKLFHTVADPDLGGGRGGGGGFVFACPADFSLSKIRGPRAPRAPPLDPPHTSTNYILHGMFQSVYFQSFVIEKNASPQGAKTNKFSSRCNNNAQSRKSFSVAPPLPPAPPFQKKQSLQA